MKLSRVVLYDEPQVPEVKIGGLAAFAEEALHARTEVRDSIFAGAPEHVMREVASLRVRDPGEAPRKPACRAMYAKLAGTERSGADEGSEELALYDGFGLQRLLSELIPSKDLSLDVLTVVLTDRLTCTYDETDRRYHGRALICPSPAIISTTGAVEAPAKPRSYYIEMAQSTGREAEIEAVRRRYSGEYLERRDGRLTEVLRGYLLQAAFLQIAGEAFCENMGCRLHNAHWQRDLLHSQIESGRLCPRHEAVLHTLE